MVTHSISSKSFLRVIKGIFCAFLCFFDFEPLSAAPAKKTTIPRYSFNAKQGDLTILGGISTSKYTGVVGQIFSYRSKLSYFASDYFGFFIGNDLPLTSGTVNIADVNYRVKLLPSKFGVFGAIPITNQVSLSIEGGIGSTLVLGSGLSTASVPLFETAMTIARDTGVWRFFIEFTASTSKGIVQNTDVDLSRQTLAIGMGLKL